MDDKNEEVALPVEFAKKIFVDYFQENEVNPDNLNVFLNGTIIQLGMIISNFIEDDERKATLQIIYQKLNGMINKIEKFNKEHEETIL